MELRKALQEPSLVLAYRDHDADRSSEIHCDRRSKPPHELDRTVFVTVQKHEKPVGSETPRQLCVPPLFVRVADEPIPRNSNRLELNDAGEPVSE